MAPPVKLYAIYQIERQTDNEVQGFFHDRTCVYFYKCSNDFPKHPDRPWFCWGFFFESFEAALFGISERIAAHWYDESEEPARADWCEFCNSSPCQCDRDPYNPVDCSAETWSNLYARYPDLLDDDRSP